MRQRAHGGEPADAHGRDGGLGSSADHYISITPLNEPKGIADGVRAAGASRRGGGIRPFGSSPDGDAAGCQVDNGRGNEKWGDASGAFFEQVFVFPLDHLESADAAADIDARALGFIA